ncbi:MAG: N-acetylmuramoyl-L-alanine amidase [Gammaproteobacteria bacterium]
MLRVIIAAIFLLTGVAHAAVEVKSVRMWPAPDNTRLVFDLTAPVEHTLFTLKAPDRVVIDMKNAHFANDLPQFSYDDTLLKGVRYANRNGKQLRVVLDLKRGVSPKSFVLKPHQNYGHRLVIDLYDKNENERTVKKTISVTGSHSGKGKPRDVIIAIDAGHGGEDPGAIGRRGTREKDVVLAIARKLNALIKNQRGMRPVMIRGGDYYVSLNDRVKRARKHDADMFISIHADAFKNHRARGSSVFVLSTRGASSETARILAESENNADLIGGVSLHDKDELLQKVLVDMVQTATIEDSHIVANKVLHGIKGVNRLHKSHVEQAGFKVLKTPGIPSILVETAFISNPEEERKLRSPRHQMAMAQAIMKGVRAYFRSNAPQGTILAMQDKKHTVSRGDTLSAIAQRYRVSVSALRRSNGLRSDTLHVGRTLVIPFNG